jgi:hypothetical protein
VDRSDAYVPGQREPSELFPIGLGHTRPGNCFATSRAALCSRANQARRATQVLVEGAMLKEVQNGHLRLRGHGRPFWQINTRG